MPERRGLIEPVPQARSCCWRPIKSGARMKVDCTRWITASPVNSAPMALRTIERPPSQPIRKRQRRRLSLPLSRSRQGTSAPSPRTTTSSAAADQETPTQAAQLAAVEIAQGNIGAVVPHHDVLGGGAIDDGDARLA